VEGEYSRTDDFLGAHGRDSGNSLVCRLVSPDGVHDGASGLPRSSNDRKWSVGLMARPLLDAAYNLARWLVGNAPEAENVVQEASPRTLLKYKSGTTYMRQLPSIEASPP
jgi:hypothetical protein